MASSPTAIEFTGECYRTIGCGAEDLSLTLPPEKAEGQTQGIRYRCPYCGVTTRLQRRSKVESGPE